MKTEAIVLSAALLAAVVYGYPVSHETEGHLQLIDAESHALEAVFFTTETGIRIHGDRNSLTLTSMSNDEVLLAGRINGNSSGLYTVVGRNFLEKTTTDENGERRKVSFVVPESLADQVKEEVEARKEERVTSQLHGQSESEVQTAQEMAFQQLLARPEIALIEPAAKALGRAGVMGYQNQGALTFYGVAIALVRKQYQQSEESTDGSHPENSPGRQKRFLFPPIDTNPWPGHDPIDPFFPCESVCFNSLCLRVHRCLCWSWVCGGCCSGGCNYCCSPFNLHCVIRLGPHCYDYFC